MNSHRNFDFWKKNLITPIHHLITSNWARLLHWNSLIWNPWCTTYFQDNFQLQQSNISHSTNISASLLRIFVYFELKTDGNFISFRAGHYRVWNECGRSTFYSSFEIVLLLVNSPKVQYRHHTVEHKNIEL